MVLLLLYAPIWALGQAEAGHAASTKTVAVLTPAALESEFFAVVREGDALKFLSYISEEGVNLGRDAQHASRDAVEEQLTHRTGLYCKLFDTACLNDGDCSYRELLTQSENCLLYTSDAADE